MPARFPAMAVVAAIAFFASTATAQPASPDPLAPALVDGTQTRASLSSYVWDTSDPRLSGQVTYDRTGSGWVSAPRDVFQEDELGFWVSADHLELRNSGGRWVGDLTALVVRGPNDGGLGFRGGTTVILAGRDGYEGLAAYVTIEHGDLLGAIFPGEMPAPRYRGAED